MLIWTPMTLILWTKQLKNYSNIFFYKETTSQMFGTIMRESK